VYVHKPEYTANLSVRAAGAERPVTAGRLFDLFTPIAPAITEPAIRGIQDALGIRQVIAVPFFLESEGEADARLIGNLFAVTQAERFEPWEIDLLQAFGRQAAAGLSNARLYRVSENRRAAGEILGRMAFSSAASVHAFRNHLGLIRGNLQLVEKLDLLAPEESQRRELMAQLMPPVMDRLGQITKMLDGLHTPWNLTSNTPVDVNQCITRAVSKIIQTPEEWVRIDLAEGLPCVTTTPDMLTEAFRTLVKNAVEAMESVEPGRRGLWVTSRLVAGNTVEVTVRDAGSGIRPEHLSKVFEMRWSTKPQGLGFGLFWTRDFVEGLGGQIRLESQWGKGSTFVVRLPAQ
jgi:signal transduction histidine kinase